MVNPTRGILYPARLPEFHRLAPPAEVADLVAWFWIPEWDIEPGRSSRQEVVSYPSLNLVVEPRGASLAGATTRASHRDLRGHGWAVGALLRPAAVAALVSEPAALIDAEAPVDAPELLVAVAADMRSGEGHRERAVASFAGWLRERVGTLDDAAHHANALFDVLMGEGAALTPEEAATRLSVSMRTLQRMTHRHIGLSPAAMIRRRRLQEAAQLVREKPGTDLATIAAEFGYADHAHLTRDFQAVLGIAPRTYRSESSAGVDSAAGQSQAQHPIPDAEGDDGRPDE